MQVDRLYAGEVGYLAAAIKAVADAKVGDTITLKKHGSREPLAGYREVVPMVFCGLFPTDADQFGDLREALGRLQLNDAALSYEPEVQPLDLQAPDFGTPCTEGGQDIAVLHVQALAAAAVLSRSPCKAALGVSSLGRELLREGRAADMLCCCASLWRPRVLRSVRVKFPE